jgi:hypothetical protein
MAADPPPKGATTDVPPPPTDSGKDPGRSTERHLKAAQAADAPPSEGTASKRAASPAPTLTPVPVYGEAHVDGHSDAIHASPNLGPSERMTIPPLVPRGSGSLPSSVRESHRANRTSLSTRNEFEPSPTSVRAERLRAEFDAIPKLRDIVDRCSLPKEEKAGIGPLRAGTVTARIVRNDPKRTDSSIALRTRCLVASRGQLDFASLFRMENGTRSAEYFGAAPGTFVQAAGEGDIVLRRAAESQLTVFEVDEGGATLREDLVAAFEHRVPYETNRIRGTFMVPIFIDFKGPGVVVLEHAMPLLSSPVMPFKPLMLRADRLAGFLGRINIEAMVPDGPAGAFGNLLKLEGEGFALLFAP